MKTYTIGFVIEQALGHITHTKNLQVNVPRDASVRAEWALVPFEVAGWPARIPVYRSNWTVRAGWRARRLLSHAAGQARLDGLFFHTQVPAVLAADWVRRYPSIVSLDATPIQYDQLGQYYNHQAGSSALEKWKWRLNRDCFRAASGLVTWSEWARQGLVSDYEVPAGKVAVIPPGVNVDEWRRPGRPAAGGVVKILFVGGNLERKGGLVLIEAFRRLRAAGRPVELHLVTRDKAPAEAGLFVYNAMQPNSAPLKTLYHECDIFCLPTYGDCFPMVLSEAGAAGLPLVSTTVAAIPEIVRPGETGLVTPAGDAGALTAALERLVDDRPLRLSLGDGAAGLVARDFDAAKNATRLLDLVKQAIDARQPRSVSHA